MKDGFILIFSPLSFSIITFLISVLDLELIDFEKCIFKAIARPNQISDKFLSGLISKLLHFLPN